VDGEMQPGERVHVTLHWRTTQRPLDADIHWFNHLLDAEGRRWGQFDGVGFPAGRWHPGDEVLFHFDIALSPDMESAPKTLFVGQYAYPSMENIPILDVAGNPLAPGAELILDSP
jgi:hypothetical protein